MENPVIRIDRKSSIETEPRTLPFHQLEHAREAAMYVMETRGVEEAQHIFTQGLEPVESVGGKGAGTIPEEETFLSETASCGMREVLSAPF